MPDTLAKKAWKREEVDEEEWHLFTIDSTLMWALCSVDPPGFEGRSVNKEESKRGDVLEWPASYSWVTEKPLASSCYEYGGSFHTSMEDPVHEYGGYCHTIMSGSCNSIMKDPVIRVWMDPVTNIDTRRRVRGLQSRNENPSEKLMILFVLTSLMPFFSSCIHSFSLSVSPFQSHFCFFC